MPVYRLRTLGQLRLDGPAGEVRGLRRKERVLLAYLARATGPIRRAELTALLWGRQPESRALHSLRQALCALRREMPEAICVGRDAVCLVRGAVELDVARLECDVRHGRAELAVARWQGDFLAGLEDTGDEPLRAWVEAERTAVGRLLSEALEMLVSPARDRAALEAAVEPVRRWAEAHPWDEAAQCRLVRLLRAAGRDAEAAAWHARAAGRLADELGREPTAAFTGLAPRAVSDLASLPAMVPVPADDTGAYAGLAAAWRGVQAGASAVVLLDAESAPSRRLLLDALCQLAAAGAGEDTAPVVLRAEAGAGQAAPEPWSAARRLLDGIRTARGLSAVSDEALAEVAVLVPALRRRYPNLPAALGDCAALRRSVRETLAELAAEAPLLMLLEDAPAADRETRQWLAGIAREAPPSTLIVLAGDPAALDADPELLGLPAVRLPGRGAAAAPSATAVAEPTGSTSSDRALADRPPALRHRWRWPARRSWRWAAPTAAAAAAVLLLLLLPFTRTGEPPAGLGDTGSDAARAFHAAGMDALYSERDAPRALHLFTTALEHDSTFAMAAYYAGVAAGNAAGHDLTTQLMERAQQLSARLPERERLYILAGSALRFNDPSGAARAAAFARRYPSDPAAAMLLGSSLLQEGRFGEAIAQLRHAASLSPAPSARPAACLRCETYEHLASAYWMADSLDAAISVTRDWVALQPTEPAPQRTLSEYLLKAGRYEEASAARQRAADLGASATADIFFGAVRSIRTGDYSAADPGLEYLARTGGSDVARQALWLQVISFRNQRRYADAWTAATRFRQLSQERGPARHPHATPQAIVLLESGRPLRAAAMFDTMFHSLGDLGRVSRTARDQAWLLTLRASALAAAGDTTQLALLADSVHAFGLASAYGRDRRLHHHVRGLLHSARGDDAAAEQEFRRAIHSPTGGYTRTNVELAGALIAQRRAAEAIAPLHSALRAPLDGPALYVTRTELYDLLARAYAAAGVPDSAAVYHQLAAAAVGGPDGGRTPAPRPRQLVTQRR